MMFTVRGTRYAVMWFWADWNQFGHYVVTRNFLTLGRWRFDAVAIGPLTFRRWRMITDKDETDDGR